MMEQASLSSSSSSSVTLSEDGVKEYLQSVDKDKDEDWRGDSDFDQDDDDDDLDQSLPPASCTPAVTSGAGTTTTTTTTTTLGDDGCYVDWDGVLVDPLYGATRLNRYISVREVDTLTGWATHRKRSHYCADQHNDDDADNPLYGSLPYAPPRPSIVQSMIQDTARQFCAHRDHDQQRMANKFTKSFPEATGMKVNRHLSALEGRLNHSAAVAIAMLAEEVLTASLLPWAVRHVRRCRELQDRVPSTTSTTGDNDDIDNENNNKHDDEDQQDNMRALRQAQQEAFDAWTLPPEEAIQILLHEHNDCSDGDDDNNNSNDNNAVSAAKTGSKFAMFARAQPPTRSAVPGAPGTSLLNLPRAGTREQQALIAWCKSQQLNPAEVVVTEGTCPTTYLGYEAFVPPIVGRSSSSIKNNNAAPASSAGATPNGVSNSFVTTGHMETALI